MISRHMADEDDNRIAQGDMTDDRRKHPKDEILIFLDGHATVSKKMKMTQHL